MRSSKSKRHGKLDLDLMRRKHGVKKQTKEELNGE